MVCKDCNRCNVKRSKCNGSESKKVTFMNRDMNACMNILTISHEWIKNQKRPERFCRTSNSDFSFEKGNGIDKLFLIEGKTSNLLYFYAKLGVLNVKRCKRKKRKNG